MTAHREALTHTSWNILSKDGTILTAVGGERGCYHKTAGPVMRKLSNISWNLFTAALEKTVNLC